MGRLGAQGWKPVVYLGSTLLAALLVVGLFFGMVRLLFPRADSRDMKPAVYAAAVLAYGTVVITTQLLKRRFGRDFGTYLDDINEDPPVPMTGRPKVCSRCGTRFNACSNDAHRAGFCSQSCERAFAKSRAASKGE